MNGPEESRIATPQDVLRFWFGEDSESPECIGRQARLWFGGGKGFDQLIARHFGHLPPLAASGGLDEWRGAPGSCLALVLVLDQFPRNLYRDSPQSYEYDALALEIAEEAIGNGFDDEVSSVEASFLYMPLEHAEDIARQDRCVSLFRRLLERAPPEFHQRCASFITYAERHREVIRRFGRFPHRNAVLDRASTSEEQAYLESGGETFGGASA
jgi:uncharacterized protein (DUF924 family)